MVATVGSISIDLVTNAAKFSDGFKRSATTVDTYSKKMGKSLGVVDNAAAAARRQLLALGAAALAGVSINAIGRYADQWTQAGNAIRAAAQISGQQVRGLKELNDIARTTRSGFGETVDLYSRLIRVSENLRASEQDIATATEVVSKAFKAGGAAASEQAAGILQLGQALGSGFLQGDELRSIRENAPLLAQAIADYFRTTIGGLKELGSEGLLTSEKVLQAILKYQDEINAAFDETVPTISDGVQQISNAFIELIGSIDSATGASGRIAGGLLSVAGSIERISDAISGLQEGENILKNFFIALDEITSFLPNQIGGDLLDRLFNYDTSTQQEIDQLKRDISDTEAAIMDVQEAGDQSWIPPDQVSAMEANLERMKRKLAELEAAARAAAAATAAVAKAGASLPGVNAIRGAPGVTVNSGPTTGNPATTVGTGTGKATNGIDTTNPNWYSDWLAAGAPQMATGGVVTKPTAAYIGEAGPEAVVPLAGGSIPVSLGGGGSLGSIEMNTARSADYLQQAVQYLDVIDSDLMRVLRVVNNSITASGYGSSSYSSSGGALDEITRSFWSTGRYGTPVFNVDTMRAWGGTGGNSVNLGGLTVNVSGDANDRSIAAMQDGLRRELSSVLDRFNG